ncbi:MAG: hypothetical protein FWC95_06695 [Defluviitaleaceae bacterium]|nr:hypothetical protein [Defluviitaleaceae bacterium]
MDKKNTAAKKIAIGFVLAIISLSITAGFFARSYQFWEILMNRNLNGLSAFIQQVESVIREAN